MADIDCVLEDDNGDLRFINLMQDLNITDKAWFSDVKPFGIYIFNSELEKKLYANAIIDMSFISVYLIDEPFPSVEEFKMSLLLEEYEDKKLEKYIVR